MALLFLRISCVAEEMALMWHAVLFFIFLSSRFTLAQISYSIPEEMPKGSMVGNVAQDLGLDFKRLISGKGRVHTVDSTEYIALDKERGMLYIKEKIDRESLCATKTPCALHIRMTLENPMELYTITVEITDINDNAPFFQTEEIRIEIIEAALPGARFMLERAMDADVGINGLQSYSLKPTDHFALELESNADGVKNVEMILQKQLDREKQERLTLILTAMDGGESVLSGTVQIHIAILDANDNAPVFRQKIYKVLVNENSPKGTKLAKVTASDADEGTNGQVTYYISNKEKAVKDMFHINEDDGEITLNGQIDYETKSHYQLDIQARDQGGLSDSCKISIDVLDINDNKPTLTILSMASSITENSLIGNIVAMINVNDPDSEVNGQVHCKINDNIPFSITSHLTMFLPCTQIRTWIEREKLSTILV
ncbi:protocadherin gamma-A8-like [Silurus meridionalis]|uniref:protocadherin gamma-A8-like n=1 Tax=Silurus meridionalis TaxID=175797 RepID=UPI001EEB6337|nr:protocadherin gamma-A8-like [Silurus meridionalis]